MRANLIFHPFGGGPAMPKTTLLFMKDVGYFSVEKVWLKTQYRPKCFHEITGRIFLARFAKRHQCRRCRHGFTQLLLGEPPEFARNLEAVAPKNIAGPCLPQNSILSLELAHFA